MSSAGKKLAPLQGVFLVPWYLADTIVSKSTRLSSNIGEFSKIARDHVFSDSHNLPKTFTLSKLLKRENCARKRSGL